MPKKKIETEKKAVKKAVKKTVKKTAEKTVGYDYTIDDIRQMPFIKTYLKRADKYLEAIGYTEHGLRHAGIVCKSTHYILSCLNYPPRQVLLGTIAAYLHDIGNLISRKNHGITSALMAQKILEQIGLPIEEAITVMSAIANHDEQVGEPTDPLAAALIIADKADVHRTRVRNENFISFDIHDRVNFAVTESFLKVNKTTMEIILDLTIDTQISQVMEYFEIFLERMLLCRKSAKILKCNFGLVINDTVLL
ncbi:HD domain-containing protein [Thermodesulfobacteriota bacterium]